MLRRREQEQGKPGFQKVGYFVLAGCFSWKNILSAPMWPQRQSFAPGCSSGCGTTKGSVGGTGLTFKSDEELSFKEIFSGVYIYFLNFLNE